MTKPLTLPLCVLLTLALTLNVSPAGATQLAVLYDYEIAGSLGNDVSGNGNTGAVTPTVTSVAGRNVGGLGAQFDGSTGKISRGPLAGGYTGTPGFTFASWVRRATAVDFDGVITQDVGGVFHRLLTNSGGSPYFDVGAHQDASVPGALALNTWHFLVMTGEDVGGTGRLARIYLDGSEMVGSPNNFGGLPPGLGSAAAMNTYIGVGEGGIAHFMNGALDDTGVFDGAMSAAYVRGVYELAVEPTLVYDLSEANQLLELFEATTGIVAIGDQSWIYATGLSGTPGDLQVLGNTYILVLDQFGNGVLAAPVPEPSTFGLLGCGVVGLVVRARRKK